MPHLAFRSSSHRDADNELYDRGAELIESATEIRRLVTSPEAAPALPALLGCLESALGELAGASAALQEAVDDGGADERSRAAAERLRRGYRNLTLALEDAQTAAGAARSLAARRTGEDRGRRRR